MSRISVVRGLRISALILAAGCSDAVALAVAQQYAIDGAAFRSPFYWAGFVLDGSL